MRTFLAQATAALFASTIATGGSHSVAAAPCITATAACERWLTYGSGPARSMMYSTHSLDAANASVTRALIMVHGAGRNADHYFATATAAGFLAGALDNTVIVAPHLIAPPDKPGLNEVVWPNGNVSWRAGGMSTTNPTLSSFDFIDNLVLKLADKKVFPNLTTIVVAGHSAGGQVVTRYQMANKVHGTRGVSITYVVANPSSYAWPAAVRPLSTGDADPTNADKEALGADGEKVHTTFTYGAFDSTKLPAYNQWPAGLEGLAGYTAGMSAEQLRKQLVERPATYLLGQVDVLPLGGFDASPVAMAQGPTRRARGEAFFKYATETMGAKATAIVVPECGHNDRCIFTTDVVLPVIFPPSPDGAHQARLGGGSHPLIGAQLYSFREQAKGDPIAMLNLARGMGITDVETAGLYGMPVERFADALKAAGLHASSMHASYDDFKKNPETVIANARALGAKYVGLAWYPHTGDFTEADARRAVADFNEFGRAMRSAGLVFFYHNHGYEPVVAGNGTLLDIIIQGTDPALVSFEMDVLWTWLPGVDPAALIRKYPGRFKLMHIKDMKAGVPRGSLSGGLAAELQSIIGQGQVNWPDLLKEAERAGFDHYYLEDETPDPLVNVPKSIVYLERLKY